MKLAVPVLEWGGKNFELWEEKVKLVLMSRQWKDVGVALEGVGTEEVIDHGGQDGRQAGIACLGCVTQGGDYHQG